MTVNPILGNYAAKNFREAETSRGVAWYTDITLNDIVVGSAENSGLHGETSFLFNTPLDAADFLSHAAIYENAIEIDPGASFLELLTHTHEMNRKREMVFIVGALPFPFNLAQDEPVDHKVYAPSKATLAQKDSVIERLKSMHPGEDIHFWDKIESRFVAQA